MPASADAAIISHLRTLCWLQVAPGGRILRSSDSLRRLIGFDEIDLNSVTFPKLFCAQEESGELPHAQSILTANQSELRTWAHWKHKNGNLVPVGLFYKCMEDTAGSIFKEAFSVPMLVVAFERERQGEMEEMVATLQTRLEDALNHRQRLVVALNKHMGTALASAILSVNTLKTAAARIPGGIGAKEISRIEESLNTCQRILDEALSGGFKAK